MKAEVLDSVAFVATDHPAKPKFRGTVFFVDEDAGIGRDGREKIWGYMVTAKHVAEKIAKGDAAVRLNTTRGTTIWETFTGAKWWHHPSDRTADVALIRWAPSAEIVKYKRWNTKNFATSEIVSNGKVAIHDDVQTIGLFRAHPGSVQNTPVLRTGNVAMLPQEPVQTSYGPMDAYLVESRSIGGLSGSPVVVTETMLHAIGGAKVKGIGEVRLLGLVHGHYDVKNNASSASDPELEILNSGIALIVPAQKILDTIGQEEIQELKARERSALLG